MWKLLSQRIFLPLFITQFLEALNDNLFKYAFIALITYHLYASDASTGNWYIALSSAIFTLPYLLLSGFSGELADKFDKAHLIRYVKLFEVFSMLLGAAGFYFQSPALLLATLGILGIHSTLFGPIKYAILPQHLDEKDLLGGNALIEGGTFLAILIGTILANLFANHDNGTQISSVIAITFSIIGLCVSFYIPSAPPGQSNLKLDWNIFRSTHHIIQQSRANKRVFLAILGISWFWLIGTAFMTVFPNFIKVTLHGNINVLTLFIVIFSVGIALGSLLAERLQKHEISARYVPISALIMTVFMLDLTFTSMHYTHTYNALIQNHPIHTFLSSPQAWHICISTFFIAVFAGIYTVPLFAIIQHESNPKYRSRIIATNNIINALFMIAISLCIMAWTEYFHYSITTILLFISCMNFVVAIYICKLLPEELIKSILERILILFYKVEVKGMEHYKRVGSKAIIIANHSSFLDALLLAVFLPNKPMFAINTHVAEKWWIRLFLPLVEAFPMDPTNSMSTKALINAIKTGKSCVIFPEGRLTTTGNLMKIYEGSSVIADRSDSPILPIRIDGALYTPFTRARGKVITKWFPKITITILKPTFLELKDTLKAKERRHIANQKLYQLMTQMMFDPNIS